jgi:Beta-ketoacyl synthase, N-terminal domain
MTALTAYVEGIGVLGPGLKDWPSTRAVLAGELPYESRPTVLPLPESLPPAERRRTGRIVKLALAVGLEATARACVHPSHLPTVFSSSGGDGQNCHDICETLASSDRQLSPTRFHNSVHNVAAGYWSIANGARAPSNAICAYDASFAAGLLESLTQLVVEGSPNLLVAYDSQYPEPLFSKRPIPDAFAIALLLSPERRSGSLARLTASLTDTAPQIMAQPELEKLRSTIPAARGLPLLQSIAVRQNARVVLEYLEDLQLAVEVEPCG